LTGQEARASLHPGMNSPEAPAAPKKQVLFLAAALTALASCSSASNTDLGPDVDVGRDGGAKGSGGKPGGSGGQPSGGSGGNASGGETGGAGGNGPGSGGAGPSSGGAGPAGVGGSGDGSAGGTTGADGPGPAEAGGADAVAAGKTWTCPAGPFEAPKAGPSKAVCAGFGFKYGWNEGPTWVAGQNAFYFSNFTINGGNGGIGDMIKFTPATGQCELFIEGNGCNGLAVAPDGGLVAVCQKPRAVLKYDLATKQPTVLATMAEGKMLDSPNDVVVHRNGNIYFTNPPNDLGGRPVGLGPALMRIDPMGQISVIARGQTNGIAISADEKRLYVVFMGIWELDDLGAPLKKAGAFPLGNDGLTVDCAGNVYDQGGNIHGPDGGAMGKFPGGTNMAFGGPEGKTILVVSGKGVHTVEMNLPGLPY
jgi:gluconolactonase